MGGAASEIWRRSLALIASTRPTSSRLCASIPARRRRFAAYAFNTPCSSKPNSLHQNWNSLHSGGAFIAETRRQAMCAMALARHLGAASSRANKSKIPCMNRNPAKLDRVRQPRRLARGQTGANAPEVRDFRFFGWVWRVFPADLPALTAVYGPQVVRAGLAGGQRASLVKRSSCVPLSQDSTHLLQHK